MGVSEAIYDLVEPKLCMMMAVIAVAREWFRQAQADLAQAKSSLVAGHFEWACFAAQQSAGKATRAVHANLGSETWGQSITELLQALIEALQPSSTESMDNLLEMARALDKLTVATQYLDKLPVQAPADYYARAQAERAILHAEELLAFCTGVLSR